MVMAGDMSVGKNQTQSLMFLMAFLFLVQLFAPLVSANGMQTCDGNSGSCDDYSSAHDLTPNQQDWINGSYDFKLVGTDQIQLSMVWAIHEFNRSAIGFGDSSIYSSFLATDGIGEHDGAPADLIRNYFDERPDGPGTPTIKDKLKLELNEALESNLESGFGTIADLSTDYVDTFTQSGSQIQCSDDPSDDSTYNGEGQTVNNAFHPPICIGSTFTINIASTDFSISSSPDLELERAYQGLLVMGAEITSNFTLLTLPGHIGFYSFSPPDYGNILAVDASGVIAARAGPEPYFAGEWTVDYLNAPIGAPDEQTPIDVTIGHRNRTGTTTVVIPEDTDGIDLKLVLDLSVESAATIDMIAGISYLDSATMSDWGISLFDGSNGATIPHVTSDGIRLAYQNGLVDLDLFTDSFPIDSIAQNISQKVGSSGQVSMGELSWVSDGASEGLPAGGLNYSHGSDCTETLPAGQIRHYCTLGSAAMGIDYPVYLRATSQPFQFSLSEMVKGNFENDDYDQYIDLIDDSDIKAFLDSGLEIETILPEGILDSAELDDLPQSSLTLEIVLPPWVRTIGGDDRITISSANPDDRDISFAAHPDNVYEWRNEIKDSDDNVLCTVEDRTCISSNVDLDISALRINEWSQSVAMDFALDAEVSVYRIIIPTDKIEQNGDHKINISSAPSDLLRFAVDFATGLSEPKVIDIDKDICEDDEEFEVCSRNLSFVFTPEGIEEFSVELGEIITLLAQERASELAEVEDSPFGTVDMSGFEIITEIRGLSGYDGEIDDETPIEFYVEIPEVEFKLDLDGNLGELMNGDVSSLELNFFATAFRELILSPVVTASQLLGIGLTNGLVSAGGLTYPPPESGTESVTFSADPSISEEYGISVSGPFSITLPRGISIADWESSGGYLTVEEDRGRQKITYNVPNGEFEDTISFRVEVSWLYLVMQFWVYPTFVLILLALFVRRVVKKRKLKKERKQTRVADSSSKVAIGDSEFADLKGFHSEGLHGDLEQFEDYSNPAAPPSMVDLDDVKK